MEDLTETEIGGSVESFQKFLDSQRELFHNQIDHLQRIVVTQCKLTGVNPLSQEMVCLFPNLFINHKLLGLTPCYNFFFFFLSFEIIRRLLALCR